MRPTLASASSVRPCWERKEGVSTGDDSSSDEGEVVRDDRNPASRAKRPNVVNKIQGLLYDYIDELASSREKHRVEFAYSAPIRYFNSSIHAVLMTWLVEEATAEEKKQLCAFVLSVRSFEQTRQKTSFRNLTFGLVRQPSIIGASRVQFTKTGKRRADNAYGAETSTC